MNTPSPASPLYAVTEAKRNLRSVMQARREILHNLNPHAADELCSHILQNVNFPAGCLIGSYYNFGAEMSPRPLVQILRQRGHTILLPVISDKAKPLLFRTFTSEDTLVPGWHGIMEPQPLAPLGEPDILLVPLLAFNKNLYRLGYGGGYYDRTLAKLRSQKPVIAIGIAFQDQLVSELPLELHDVRLDRIATEAHFYN